MRSCAILLRPLACVSVAWAGTLLCSTTAAGADPASDYAKDVRPLVARYCGKCHGEKDPKSELNLARFRDEPSVLAARPQWKKVWHALHAREMPPLDEPQPTPAERDRLTDWIEGILSRPDLNGQKDPGRPVVRRLSRTEYSHTVCELIPSLKLRPLTPYYDPAKGFPEKGFEQLLQLSVEDSRRVVADLPPDDIDGFDNLGEVMTLSPVLFEQYLAAASELLESPNVSKDNRLFVARPGPKKTAKEAAREILAKFLPRAFRRPVTDREIDQHLELFGTAQSRGDSFEASVRTALSAVLTSPHFLFRVERDPPSKDAGGVRAVNDYELASRLSYFLWSSMPDDELFELARQGKLHEDAVLEQQVQRMLRSPKSKALADNFAVQWLGLSDFESTMPDPQLYPLFYEDGYFGLRWFMRQEAILFFEVMLMEDRNLLEFLDADWAVLNGGLEQLYGLSPSNGGWRKMSGKEYATWKKVKLPDHRRGGLLTMAATLSVTSPPTRTSPVKRGKWVLDTILGMPPPPPLPNAGTIPDDPTVDAARSIRQKLERHRQDPNCASCHRRMDPLGFALENYDAIGQWRTTEWDTVEKTWDFNTEGDIEGFTRYGEKKEFATKNGSLMVNVPGGELVTPPIIKMAALDKVVMRLANPTKAKEAQLTVIYQAMNNQGGGRTLRIPIVPESDFREYTFDLTKAPPFSGTIIRLQILPAVHGTGDVTIDWIRLGKRAQETAAPTPIDPSGTLPDGTPFKDLEDFKRQLVLRYKDQFTRSLTEKMLTYALGRKLDYYDTATVREISDRVAKNDYRFSTLLLEITKSYPFRHRRTLEKKS